MHPEPEHAWGAAPPAWEQVLDTTPAVWLRRTRARGVFAWSAPDGTRCVVKRFEGARRGWFDRRTPAQVEHDNLAALAQDGIRVPRALAWLERDGRAAVVMEAVEHAETLRERLARAQAPERALWLARLAELVLRLHTRGWHHRDLYLQHFVLRGEELVLLDVGRARQAASVRERWFVKDVAALLHSTPDRVGPRERLRWAARYLDGRGLTDRTARRRWLARVLTKERRMAAHVPREGETRPWTDRSATPSARG